MNQSIIIKCDKCGNLIEKFLITKQPILTIKSHKCEKCESYQNEIKIYEYKKIVLKKEI